MLGLERVLSAKPPATAAGTELRKHQIDALAGMLTELIATTQRDATEDENGNGHVAEAELEAEELEEEDELQAGDVAESADDEDEPRVRRARIPAPSAATASAIRPPPARRSRRPGSSRRPARSAS